MINEKMEESQLVRACVNESARAIGGDLGNDEYVRDAIDYYYGRSPADSLRPEGSNYVSMDLMDAVEATVADIMPVFAQGDIAYFEPEDENDDLAEVETKLINYLFFQEYNGFIILQTALKDALLNRNCTGKASWDKRVHVDYETFENVTALALPQLLEPNAPYQKVDIVEQEVDGEEMMDETAPVMDETGDVIGITQIQEAIETYTIKIKRMTAKGMPVIESVKPENARICADHTEPDLSTARFCSVRVRETASSLIAQGFDPEIVKTLTQYNQEDEYVRSRYAGEYDIQSESDTTRLIDIEECYIHIDFDGDGIAELRKVVISGTTLLSNDEWDGVAMVGGLTTLVPHQYPGLSLYDRLFPIQNSKTAMIRLIEDGTRLSTRQRVEVVTENVNMDDMITSMTGGIVRTTQPGSINAVPNPEIPQSAYQLVNFFDQQRSERGGSSLDKPSQAQRLHGDSQGVVRDVMSAMEQGSALLSRTFGETFVRSMFLRLHDLIRNNYEGELSAKLGGRWVRSVPAEWKKRANVSIKLGSSRDERARKAASMSQVVESIKILAETGSTMFSEEKAYNAITDLAKLGGVMSPERYYVDPQSEEGQQASQQKQQKSQEKQQQEMQMQQAMMQANMTLAEAEKMKSMADIEMARIKAENDYMQNEVSRMQNLIKASDSADKNQFDYDKLESDEAIKLTELEMQANKDLSQQLEGNK